MLKKSIKTILLVALAITGSASLAPLLVGDTYAADICSQSGIPDDIREANCDGGDKLGESIKGILETVIGIAGFIAVIYIIVGGVNYMTSGGDAGKIQKAKNTILYALIGLIICALAFAIVNWTIGAIQG